MDESKNGTAEQRRLVAVVFHNCGLAVNGHRHDLLSASIFICNTKTSQ